jgi:hypothetical protein
MLSIIVKKWSKNSQTVVGWDVAGLELARDMTNPSTAFSHPATLRKSSVRMPIAEPSTAKSNSLGPSAPKYGYTSNPVTLPGHRCDRR